MYRYKIDGRGASIGCGIVLLLLGIILLSPFVGWLISLLTDLLGWVLVVVGLIGSRRGYDCWVDHPFIRGML